MERKTSIAQAKLIMGKNFIGPNELQYISEKMGFLSIDNLPDIPFSYQELNEKKELYILLLGAKYKNTNISLSTLRNTFGIDPCKNEVCFYNQDWYIKDKFFQMQLECKWYLIRKELIDKTRGINIDKSKYKQKLPSAVLCAYTFFCWYFLTNEFLWKNDFIWCNDFDSNNDRIYVGRYIDPLGIAKNGFSIHRHLKITNNYGCI